MARQTHSKELRAQLATMLPERRTVEPVLALLRQGTLPAQSLWDFLWAELLLREKQAAHVVQGLVKELSDPDLLRLAQDKYLEAYAAAFAAIRVNHQLGVVPRPKQIWPACTPAVELVVKAFAREVACWLDEGGAQHFAHIPTPVDLFDPGRASELLGIVQTGMLLGIDDDVGWARQSRVDVESDAARAMKRPVKSTGVSVRQLRKARGALGLPAAVVLREGNGLSQQRLRRTTLYKVLVPLHPPISSSAREIVKMVARQARPQKKPRRRTLKERVTAISRSELERMVPEHLQRKLSNVVPKASSRAAPTRQIVLGICLGLHLNTPWDDSKFRQLGLPAGKTVLERIKRWQDAGAWHQVVAAFSEADLPLDEPRVATRRPARPRKSKR